MTAQADRSVSGNGISGVSDATPQSWIASENMHARARTMFPGGLLHAIRKADPFPLYFKTGEGSRKWDVDGNEYIDYQVGSGAYLLGHQHPAVVQAMQRQVQTTYHMGRGHPLELEWGARIQNIVPNAELIRFTNSGTEATLLAMRVARAHTRRSKILRFFTHYHGWQDYAMVGSSAPFDAPPGGGVPDEIAALMLAAPADDPRKVEHLMRDDGDIAAVIVEASGASYGHVPLPPGFLTKLRDITAEHGALLILDETITGLRWAPGGVQQTAGIDADLVTLGKIVSGGMPGAALAGKQDIMQVLDDPQDTRARVIHGGTFNANPLAAAAGIATLDIVAHGEPQQRAAAIAAKLRAGLNALFRDTRIAGCVYGESSTFHTFFGDCPPRETDDDPMWSYDPGVLFAPHERVNAVHKALQARGVDLMSSMSGMTCCEHSDADVERTVDAYAEATRELLERGVVQRRT